MAVGWWGIRAMHPRTEQIFELAETGQVLPPDLAALLAAHRRAVGPFCDVAA